MTTSKPLACVLGLLSLPIGMATAQNALELQFRDNKRFLIVGPAESEYLGGTWEISVVDGTFPLLSPCYDGRFFPGDPEAGLPFQNPNIFCPNGTTSLITQGDFDGDGLQDSGRYFSTDRPIAARSIEPFSDDEVQLFAAPASDLPRPVASFNWTDQSIVGFYDLVSDPINGTGFAVTDYLSVRPYLPSELSRHRDEIVPGVYLFRFPALGSTPNEPRDFFMSVAHREMVEAAPGPGGQSVESGGISVGNDFRLFDDERWNEDGFMEMDPRLGFDFNWEGFNTATFFGNDLLRFSIRDRETGLILYPPIPFPEANPETRQLIGSSELGIPSGVELGANFFEPNQSITAELEFVRSLVDGSSVDASTRIFNWNIDLIDSYQGFRRQNFPLGTPAFLREPDFDYDDDGFTNLEEFALQTDPVDAASVPVLLPLIDDFTNQCFLEIPKRPAVGNSITYSVEYSLDLETWTTITRDDPNWFIVFDNDERIEVLSRRPSSVMPCFLRIRIEQG